MWCWKKTLVSVSAGPWFPVPCPPPLQAFSPLPQPPHFLSPPRCQVFHRCHCCPLRPATTLRRGSYECCLVGVVAGAWLNSNQQPWFVSRLLSSLRLPSPPVTPASDGLFGKEVGMALAIPYESSGSDSLPRRKAWERERKGYNYSGEN